MVNSRNESLSARDTVLGSVLAVSGSQASVRLRIPTPSDTGADDRATVGRFVGISYSGSLLVGVITNVCLTHPAHGEGGEAFATGQVDLMGEIRGEGAASYFQRGVTDYPMIGDPVRLITNDELRLIYDLGTPDAIKIGHLHSDSSIDAYVSTDAMLSKHFAVLGTTGVGKSSGVALVLRKLLDARPTLRIFLIDPHNEYARCFGSRAQVLNPRNLDLPFWLFNFEEIVDVFFRGRPGVEEEVAILSELIPQARTRYAESSPPDRSSIRRHEPKNTTYTVDTPVPYRLGDLLDLINELMGKLENRSSWAKYHRLLTRIEAIRTDPRYRFMFENANTGRDGMAEVLNQLFRLLPDGRPMTIMQLAGFPAEVVDSVVSVLGRMAFDLGLWSNGALPMLFVCEEAHRYAPADRALGFGPTRKALSRIAKEGRKYGVFLGLVTQRPGELDATIVSQCSTILAMRMANERDQAIVRSAVSDAASGLLAFVPSLGTREVFAFGEGVALPTRLHFETLPEDVLPKSEAVGTGDGDAAGELDAGFLAAVIGRWRGATMNGKPQSKTRREAMTTSDDPVPPADASLRQDKGSVWAHRRATLSSRVNILAEDREDGAPNGLPADVQGLGKSFRTRGRY